MTRIFLVLSLVALTLLVASAVVAFVLGDFGTASRRYFAARRDLEQVRATADVSSHALNEQSARLEGFATALKEQRNSFWPHVWLGIVASLVALFVNSISITYFIGTGRWCKEVADAYSLEPEVVRRAQSLKRISFFWSLTGILTALAIAGLGAAADPFGGAANPASWLKWHWAAGLGGLAVIAMSLYAQLQHIGANHDLIQDVLASAERIRAEHAEGVTR